MTKGEKLLNIEYSSNIVDNIEHDGALLIDRIFDMEEDNSEDRERKENAIKHIVEAVMWAKMIDGHTFDSNVFGIIER